MRMRRRERCSTLPAVCAASYTVAGRGAAVRRLWEVRIGKGLSLITITAAFARAGYIRWVVFAPRISILDAGDEELRNLR